MRANACTITRYRCKLIGSPQWTDFVRSREPWSIGDMAPQHWPVEHASDAYDILREKESKMPQFRFRSPQISARPNAIVWIFTLAEQFKLGTPTVHLAVHILDRFMDCHYIPKEKIKIVVLTCIQLAAKFEDGESSAPKIPEMNLLVENQYHRRDFIQQEIQILNFIDWNFFQPIAIKFAEYYALLASSQSDWDVQRFSSYEGFWCVLQKAIRDFLDLSLEEVEVLAFLPSIVAGACVVLARRQLSLKPLWTPSLIKLTHYSLNDLIPCAKLLLRRSQCSAVSRKRKLAQSPDQGYATGGSSNSSPETQSKRTNVTH